MERLTLDEAIKHAKEVAKTNLAEATYNFPDLKEYYDNCSECANQHNQLAEWLEELKSFKEAEEQGLLVRLPVATGTNVYVVGSFLDCIYDYEHCEATQKWKCEEHVQCEYEKKKYYVKEIKFTSIMKNSIGKSIFLTREEAEKKLEAIKKNDRSDKRNFYDGGNVCSCCYYLRIVLHNN